ncbi:hypothetical protein N431DRAFT_490459 [Stipitochalara longipes BDJ]|nr:hypothetical protein N431DRAFT_490459 [Stipitochalara longipes BDJ]
MAPEKYEDPPQETIPDGKTMTHTPIQTLREAQPISAKEDRLALLALIDKWLKLSNMKSRRLSTFIDVDPLKLPTDAQFPREWTDQSKATPYRSYSSVKVALDNTRLEVKDPFPQLVTKYGCGDGAASRSVVDQIIKRPGETTTKMITEVGTAIVIWILQDPKFISEMPPFKTNQDRLAWFRKVLQEKPLLYLILMYQCLGSSLDILFVFPAWQYAGTITSYILGIVYHSQFQHLKPELDEFPVAPRWPTQNRRVPWGIVAGAAEYNDGDDEDNEVGNDEETLKGKKSGKISSCSGLGGNKRQRR